jgi:hypothetical protein
MGIMPKKAKEPNMTSPSLTELASSSGEGTY